MSDYVSSPSIDPSLRAGNVVRTDFAEILLENAVLYHGSATSGIEQFAAAHEETVGRGIYFVDNPDDAASYATLRSERDHSPAVVYEAQIDKARLIDLDDPTTLDAVVSAFADSLRAVDTSDMPWFAQGAIDKAIEAAEKGVQTGKVKLAVQTVGDLFSEYLASLGYDGLKTHEGGEGPEAFGGEGVGEHDTYVLFGNDSIRSTRQVIL